MTRKPSAGNPNSPRANDPKAPSISDPPITGVASGSLGTAANLDDTQVMRIADLERAAAEAGVAVWLADDVVPEPENVPGPERVHEPARMKPRGRVAAPGPAQTGSRIGRRTSALAGAAVGAVLVLLAGAALFGNLGNAPTSPGAGQGAPLADSSVVPFTTPSAEPPKEGKGCNGKGKGNDCKD